MYTKHFTCCFTGHRKIPAADCLEIQKHLEEEIINLIHQGVTEFRAGGALGFDTLAALAVIKLKPAFTNVRLFLILPYRDQAKGRSKADKKTYNQILSHADKVVYTSEHYYSGCMHKRNRALVYSAHVFKQNNGRYSSRKAEWT